eukprot:169582_1
MPTYSPSSMPSKIPTTIPTNMPTVSPNSAHPTTAPTNIPTVSPITAEPTTFQPSASPSIVPTDDPTKMPSFYPSNNPSMYPTTIIPTTLMPSNIPSINPTTLIDTCHPDLLITSEWSSSYLYIYIKIENKNVNHIMQWHKLEDKCQSIFDVTTINLIGNDAYCKWKKDIENIHRIMLVVILSPLSIIQTTNKLIMKKSVIMHFCKENNELYTLKTDENIAIASPYFSNPPNIIMSSLSTQIGPCDDLILDAISTTSLGGRDNGVFEWKINEMYTNTEIYTNYGKYIVVENSILNKGKMYEISLKVTNWYNAMATEMYSVYVADMPVPMVSLHGISDILSNKNGFIDIYSIIKFEDTCNTNIESELMYEITWTVSVKHNHVDIDDVKLRALELFLSNLDMDMLSIDTDKYLQMDYYIHLI